jgi:hypothetical protein
MPIDDYHLSAAAARKIGLAANTKADGINEIMELRKLRISVRQVGMARAGKNGGGLFYEIKFGWPAIKDYEKL